MPRSEYDRVISGPLRTTLFFLAMPTLAEQILNTLVGLVDTYLAGRFSAAATSAVGLAAYVDWLASMLVMLVGTGTTALVSRHTGARDLTTANHFANQSLTLAAIVGVCMAVLLYSLAPFFAWYCNMSGEAYDLTVSYLRIAAHGHTVMGITLVGCAALRGVGNMRVPMLIFAVINVVNVLASLGLVYGTGPLPQLGVTGIAVGTVVARCCGAGLVIVVLCRGQSGLRVILRHLPLRWAETRRILRIGLPAVLDGAILWTGHFLFLAILSRLAPDPLGQAYFAAHIVAIRMEAFTYLPATAWAVATATMIGQALGAGDEARARRAGHEGVLQCGLLSMLIAVLFYFGAGMIYKVMSNDPLVQRVGTEPFRVLAILQPCMVASIVYVGALRGAGDTRFPLLITLMGTILIRVPVGYFFGIVLDGGLMGAWCGMFADMIWRAVASTIRFTFGRWTKTNV